jgi:urea carboxylase
MRLIEVLSPGVATTVQDLPGRAGLWGVGVPPSGAWDDLSFALANLAVGNAAGEAGLEAALRGPKLRFHAAALICVTGAATGSTLDGTPVTVGMPTAVAAGQVLDLGAIGGPGLRAYLAVCGGLMAPTVLGSRSTFLLGGFGGVAGRALRVGDMLPVADAYPQAPVAVTPALPPLTDEWQIRVIPGPHGAPEYLTPAGAEAFFETEWRLDHRSDRTGVRLVGPAPEFARHDGGEAGLHPSNIHDSAYPMGAIMISGGTPVVVGPDGPSLGGFVVPAVVIRADRWKLAQCRPGDRVRLAPVTLEQAEQAWHERARQLAAVAQGRASSGSNSWRKAPFLPGRWQRPELLLELPGSDERPALSARWAGDHHLLVEVGPARLDLAVRLRVHLLARALADAGLTGVTESVEGVRSLLLATDPTRLPLPTLAELVGALWTSLPDLTDVELPVREVTMPIAFDDPSVHEAMARYRDRVRPDAPWCPDNVEFIRRVNGLDERADVFDVVRAATYLVVGLGDVYLGAPVAVPLDPRHRLVTTKYDPPRTWTPANAVGIGGVYLCVYGMEGPGGYQLVGRTVPVWRDPLSIPDGEPPWLLRQFDLLRFEPVSPQELLALRAGIASGAAALRIRPATLRLSDLTTDEDHSDFTGRRREAFAAERERWALAGAASSTERNA